jgi:hypothetical protein
MMARSPSVAVEPAGSLPRQRPGPLLVLLSLLLFAACGGNLTAGGLTETEVRVSGDAPDPPPPGASPVMSGPWAQSEDDDDDDDAEEAEGEIEADFLLFLDRPDGTSLRLTDQEVQVDLDIQGEQEVSAVVRSVPAERYSALRVVFSEIEVEIDAGLVIDGQPVTGLVSVDVELEGITVVRPLDLDFSDGEREELLLDLNTRSWITAVDPDGLRVSAQAFADAIRVEAR